MIWMKKISILWNSYYLLEESFHFLLEEESACIKDFYSTLNSMELSYFKFNVGKCACLEIFFCFSVVIPSLLTINFKDLLLAYC